VLVFIFYKTEFKTCVQLLFLTEKIRVHMVKRVEIMRVERVNTEVPPCIYFTGQFLRMVGLLWTEKMAVLLC